MVAVAVFVSVPFTTYALLAGLQTIPTEVYEAARVDGAATWRTYWSITLPLLRPALTVAILINLMNVFNSFPIIWAMTRGGPGDETATTTILMYQIKSSSIPESAAMSVVNFGLVIVIVLLFLRVSRGARTRRHDGHRGTSATSQRRPNPTPAAARPVGALAGKIVFARDRLRDRDRCSSSRTPRWS